MTGLRADAHALASSQTQEAPKALNINTKQTLREQSARYGEDAVAVVQRLICSLCLAAH